MYCEQSGSAREIEIRKWQSVRRTDMAPSTQLEKLTESEGFSVKGVPNFLAFTLYEISAFIRTGRQTNMARSTLLVILIKNMYILSKMLPSTCYILSNESSIPVYYTSNGYKIE